VPADKLTALLNGSAGKAGVAHLAGSARLQPGSGRDPCYRGGEPGRGASDGDELV